MSSGINCGPGTFHTLLSSLINTLQYSVTTLQKVLLREPKEMLFLISQINTEVSPSGKARDFDSLTRRFKSCHLCQQKDHPRGGLFVGRGGVVRTYSRDLQSNKILPKTSDERKACRFAMQMTVNDRQDKL